MKNEQLIQNMLDVFEDSETEVSQGYKVREQGSWSRSILPEIGMLESLVLGGTAAAQSL